MQGMSSELYPGRCPWGADVAPVWKGMRRCRRPLGAIPRGRPTQAPGETTEGRLGALMAHM